MPYPPTRFCEFLARIDGLDPKAQIDALIGEVIETGGTLTLRHNTHRDNEPAAKDFEMTLHGVFAKATEWPELLHNWKIAANRHLAALSFPAPRTHAEEIANARASTSSPFDVTYRHESGMA